MLNSKYLYTQYCSFDKELVILVFAELKSWIFQNLGKVYLIDILTIIFYIWFVVNNVYQIQMYVSGSLLSVLLIILFLPFIPLIFWFAIKITLSDYQDIVYNEYGDLIPVSNDEKIENSNEMMYPVNENPAQEEILDE